MDTVRYLEPIALATHLRDPAERPKTIVIDVRDDDYEGGHIVGAINVPSDMFNHETAIDTMIDEKLAGAERAVLHCMFSQQRGPRCAMKLAQRLKERGKSGQPFVFVLRGGWMHFMRQYKSDEDLVEEVSEHIWGK